jgi:hypothetical protein
MWWAMTINLAFLLSPSFQKLGDSIVTSYQHAQIPLATLSFGLFAASFTAMSTLTRIKDKLYDTDAYQKRVAQLRAINKELVEFKSYQQVENSFTFMRWACLASGILNILLGFWANWWTSATGFAIFLFLLFVTSRVVWFFHVNLAEITRMDQEALNEENSKAAKARAAQPKPYAKLES